VVVLVFRWSLHRVVVEDWLMRSNSRSRWRKLGIGTTFPLWIFAAASSSRGRLRQRGFAILVVLEKLYWRSLHGTAIFQTFILSNIINLTSKSKFDELQKREEELG